MCVIQACKGVGEGWGSTLKPRGVCVCACMSIICPMCEYGEEGEAQALHESLE